MKMSKSNFHIADLLFTITLFLVFTVCSLIVVLVGANVYKKTVSYMTGNYDMRTSLTYISQKVRQNDVKNGVYLDKLNDKNALVLEQKTKGKVYQTWIYYDNGSIKEIFTQKGNNFSPDNGQEIIQVKSFEIDFDENKVFTFTTTDKSGKTATVKSFSRCSK